MEPADILPLADRLLAIHQGLSAVLADFRPEEAAVEQTFVNKDGVATLKLGQARGVAMLAPAMFGITVAEYAPNQVKKTVVGAGHADKKQIFVMLKILLPKAEPKSPDAADALAIAITHAHHRASAALKLKWWASEVCALMNEVCLRGTPTPRARSPRKGEGSRGCRVRFLLIRAGFSVAILVRAHTSLLSRRALFRPPPCGSRRASSLSRSGVGCNRRRAQLSSGASA